MENANNNNSAVIKRAMEESPLDQYYVVIDGKKLEVKFVR